MKTIYDAMTEAIDGIDEKYLIKTAKSFQLPKEDAKRNITINAEDLVEMKKEIKKTNRLAKITAVAAAFICVMTVAILLVVNNNKVQVLGGSTENSLISDPFQTEESKTDTSSAESTPVRPPSHNRGGFSTEVNGNSPINYKGGTLSIPIKVSSPPANEMDISVGVTVFIDGVAQKLSVDDGETVDMYIIKIKPGDYEKVTLDINPQIMKGAENKSELPIHFVWHFNPDYMPNLKKPDLGNTHKSMPSPNTTLNVTEKIENVIDCDTTPEIEKILITDDIQEKYGITSIDKSQGIGMDQIDDDYAASQRLIKAGKDKKADFEVHLNSIKPGKYRISFYKNNKLISFNENETYIDVETESGYLYLTDIAIEDISIGDIVHAIAIPYDYTKEDGYKSCMISYPNIAVSDDFRYIEEEE